MRSATTSSSFFERRPRSRLFATNSRDGACSTKLAKRVVDARASSDPSCRGLTEKSEIVQKAREIVQRASGARVSRARAAESASVPERGGGDDAERRGDDETVVDKSVSALAKERAETSTSPRAITTRR